MIVMKKSLGNDHGEVQVKYKNNTYSSILKKKNMRIVKYNMHLISWKLVNAQFISIEERIIHCVKELNISQSNNKYFL